MKQTGIYLTKVILPPNEEDDWLTLYVVSAYLNGQVKYLHHNGRWLESCFDHMRDHPENNMYSGHYASREEAVGKIKEYTKFKYIYEGEELIEI